MPAPFDSADEFLLEYVETPLLAALGAGTRRIAFDFDQAMGGQYGSQWFHVKLLDDALSSARGESGRPNRRVIKREVPVWIVGGFAVGTDSADQGLCRLKAGEFIDTTTTAIRSLRSASATVGSVLYQISHIELLGIERAYSDGDAVGVLLFDTKLVYSERRSA